MFFKRKSKAEKSKEGLQGWVDQQLRQGVPRQTIWNELMNMRSLDLDGLRVRSEIERELSRVMLDRNLQGSELERSGQEDEAVDLYEANVKDAFSGTHPYERLRIIYARRKDYDSAARVCRTFIKANPASHKAAKFQEHLKKLEMKSRTES